MKNEYSDIDNLFKERLSDMEGNVEPNAWSKISDKIDASMSVNTYPKISAIKSWMYYAAVSSVIIITVAAVWVNEATSSKETTAISTGNKSIEAQENISSTGNTLAVVIEKEHVSATQNPTVKKEIKNTKKASVVEFATLEDRKEVILPDGSTALLNRNSSISYSDSYLKDYTIFVTGEVFFNLGSTSQKTVHIITHLADVEATESSFIVKTNKKELYDEIAVSSGKVSYSSLIENHDRMFILAGNKAVIGATGKWKQEAITSVNYNDWVTQKIVFTNTKLNSVFETLEKYYNVSLTTNNSEILNCRFTGTFERNNIDEILQVLSVSFDLSFNQKSQNYILSGKGCK
jgi:transmembrane sensor